MKQVDAKTHYDLLIDEGNDPFYDPPALREYMNRWDGERFIASMRLSPEKTVLEIGVGTGRLVCRVAPRCKHLTGIDFSPKTVERARENLKNYPNISLVCEDFLRYSPAETFDIVYSSLTMMHFADKSAFLAKAAALLRPRGLLCLSLDKNQRKFIECGDRWTEIFPDSAERVTADMRAVRLTVTQRYETEFATVLAAQKTE